MKYVLGLAFDHDMQHIALILKTRPSSQAGKLNGVGGAIAQGETPLDAMIRKFGHEACLQTTAADWVPFIRLGREGSAVEVFTARLSAAQFAALCSGTDEALLVLPVDTPEIKSFGVPSLVWMLAMLKDPEAASMRAQVTFLKPEPVVWESHR